MGWKELHIWLKFGIIFALIHITLFVVLVSYYDIKTANDNYAWPPVMAMLIPDFPVFMILDSALFSKIVGSNITMVTFYIFTLGTLQWFIIGAIVGFITGKIKSLTNNRADG